LILPESRAGRDGEKHGIFENLPLGEAGALLGIAGFRRRVRASILGRMREEAERMLEECARKRILIERSRRD
jgi:hypothetical protein